MFSILDDLQSDIFGFGNVSSKAGRYPIGCTEGIWTTKYGSEMHDNNVLKIFQDATNVGSNSAVTCGEGGKRMQGLSYVQTAWLDFFAVSRQFQNGPWDLEFEHSRYDLDISELIPGNTSEDYCLCFLLFRHTWLFPSYNVLSLRKITHRRILSIPVNPPAFRVTPGYVVNFLTCIYSPPIGI